ncbi:hypothetical protein WOLCODRAFT_137719 [Wolfiporia cocos MD-104 SS10]|uniref:PARP catalytic domain-containing protein n=1 Tax=Wolfiporia cocos (strain MD-104) TaxID=742152 RepID=A0A2H3K142_WOLCO|nr:hypothetical protein WOLCODRAFT_137719 [Wolfiporia cocos MD-104 SS10]
MYSSLKTAAKHLRSPSKDSGKDDMCEVCGVRPKYVEGGYKHPYCGRTCARNRRGQATLPACLLRGCRTPGDASYGGFCSEKHAREAVRQRQVQACTDCRTLPRVVGDLCATCNAARRDGGTRLRELRSTEITFQSVADEFTRAWSNDKKPTVAKIVEVLPTRESRAAFDQCRKQLHATTGVHEISTYHGAQCICDFAVNDVTLCDWKSCGVCKILRSSFKQLAFDEQYSSGRHGNGLYSHQDPSRADRFVISSTSSPYRVLLACTVLLGGRPQDQTVQSTTGEFISINDGGTVVVNTADAIVPNYVIMYRM